MEDKLQKPAPRSAKEATDRYFAVLDTIRAQSRPSRPGSSVPSIDIDEEIAREQKIKNDNAEQDITLKRQTLNRLFLFLACENMLIFGFALLQGTRWLGFDLDHISFRILVGATVLQITGMLYVAVRYLFPVPSK